MRNRWTTMLGTVALAALVGSGAAAVGAGAAERRAADDPGARPRLGGLLSGYEIVTVPSATVDNLRERTASCPPGKKALSGGASVSGDGSILVSTHPTPDGTGWAAFGRSTSGGQVAISVDAVCARML